MSSKPKRRIALQPVVCTGDRCVRVGAPKTVSKKQKQAEEAGLKALGMYEAVKRIEKREKKKAKKKAKKKPKAPVKKAPAKKKKPKAPAKKRVVRKAPAKKKRKAPAKKRKRVVRKPAAPKRKRKAKAGVPAAWPPAKRSLHRKKRDVLLRMGNKSVRAEVAKRKAAGKRVTKKDIVNIIAAKDKKLYGKWGKTAKSRTKKPSCKTGKPCGYACIRPERQCHK